jgi:D-xylose transport system permease protein
MSLSSEAPAVAPSSLTTQVVRRFRLNIQTYTIILALGAIWGFFALRTGGAFTNPQNISNLFRQMTVTSFLATGMVLVIVTGNIDLSVGRLAGFVSVVVAYLQARVWGTLLPDQGELAALLSVLAGLAVGALFGALQGYFIAFHGVPSFIVTLGGMFVLSGLILLVTEGKTIPANQPEFAVIAQAYIPPVGGWILAAGVAVALFWNLGRARRRKRQYGFELAPLALDLAGTGILAALVGLYVYVVNQYQGVQVPVLLLAITVGIMAYVANNTRFGRYAYAIGGNREAARLSGINIRRNVFLIFVLMGFLSGVAGVVLASYVGYGTIAAGTGYELDAIASCILGGTSTLGGVGTVFGALIGALITTSLTSGLQILNTPPAWQPILKGAVLVLAVFADMYFKRNR